MGAILEGGLALVGLMSSVAIGLSALLCGEAQHSGKPDASHEHPRTIRPWEEPMAA